MVQTPVKVAWAATLIAFLEGSAFALPQNNSPLSNQLTLNFSPEPPKGGQVIDGSFQSFSIEYAYMADYGGNLT